VVEKIDNSVYQHLLSGVGLGAYYLYNKIPVGADPHLRLALKTQLNKKKDREVLNHE